MFASFLANEQMGRTQMQHIMKGPCLIKIIQQTKITELSTNICNVGYWQLRNYFTLISEVTR